MYRLLRRFLGSAGKPNGTCPARPHVERLEDRTAPALVATYPAALVSLNPQPLPPGESAPPRAHPPNPYAVCASPTLPLPPPRLD